MFSTRQINLFEKILLPVGVATTVFGFYLIVRTDHYPDQLLGWARLTAIFCWMILIFAMIVAATNEDVKEELALISKEHVTEIRLLKEIVHDQLQETKLLRDQLSRDAKKH
ncbi:hypothetical protein JW930_07625 [Candidatus Woesearchaeota archaeon]|nr:hypothetical protein [Candidatus Woesearchaeota archaeon]